MNSEPAMVDQTSDKSDWVNDTEYFLKTRSYVSYNTGVLICGLCTSLHCFRKNKVPMEIFISEKSCTSFNCLLISHNSVANWLQRITTYLREVLKRRAWTLSFWWTSRQLKYAWSVQGRRAWHSGGGTRESSCSRISNAWKPWVSHLFSAISSLDVSPAFLKTSRSGKILNEYIRLCCHYIKIWFSKTEPLWRNAGHNCWSPYSQ